MFKSIKVILPILILLLTTTGCVQKKATTPKVKKVVQKKEIYRGKKKVATKIVVRNPQKKPTNPTQNISTIQRKAVKIVPSAGGKVVNFPTLSGKVIKMRMDDNLLYIDDPSIGDKKVVLFLFGRDCPHCQRELPLIKRLQYNPNIKIIGVHAYSMIGDAALKRYLKRVGYKFDVLSFKNDIKLIKFLEKHGIWDGTVPAHIVVDPNGNAMDVELNQLQ
jgi:thiol-disulfide isomerase/thioredoxin